jgi:hypothetical protein
MPTYAMVVVVEADAPEDAHLALGEGAWYAKFVGEPWEVEPVRRGPVAGIQYDTVSCIDQHPQHEELLG